MNPELVDVTVILDRSASMKERTFEALSAFNTLVNSSEFHHCEAVFNLSLFDEHYLPLMELASIEDLPELLLEDYHPNGGCALFDALGSAIDETGRRLAETEPQERPDRVIVVILTGGCENASRHYTLAEVERRIAHQSTHFGWEFCFPIEGVGHLAGQRGAVHSIVSLDSIAKAQ